MDKNTLIQRLMATFLEELEEHVRTLNQDLLALEKGPSSEEQAQRLKTLFRTAHSLKGAARSVSVSVIESACHCLEEFLAGARDGLLALTPERFALLFAAADAIEEAGMRLREQQDLTASPLAALLPRLEALGASQDRPAPPAPPAPEPPPPAEPAPAAEVVPAVPATQAEAPLDSSAASATVRIPAEKLDALLARTGELLVARRRVESRAEELARLRTFVEEWKTEWRRVERSVQSLLGPEAGGPVEDGDTAVRSRPLPRRVALALGHTGENLRQLEKDLEHLAAALASDGRFLRQVAGPLNADVRRARMLPFAEACQGLDRVTRDLARAGGKEVELVVAGGAVELDRSVLEGLKDPLRHLVRNAVDHGAEPPAVRRAAGKPPRARVTVTAALRGAQVAVTVQDDGRGLDFVALRAQGRRRNLADPADDREAAQLIFLPGLSTAPLVTDVSGRGVGLDVVKSRVEALHGTVEVGAAPGGGTCFTLTVPLTLTTLRAVLVAAGGQTYAFAGTSIQRVVRVGASDLRSVAGRQMLALGGPPLPVVPLTAALGLSAAPPAAQDGKTPALVLAAGDRRMAFTVDELLAEQEVMVSSLGSRLRRLRCVSGATLLPSGRVALVLNAANLVRASLGAATLALAAPAGPAPRKRLLVVDDSVTTRALEKSILEAAGYEVLTAADGLAGWQLLQERGADLLVSDVEMPRMDGLTLTETVRAAPRFRELPVVLVTSRASEEDRARGLQAGADAYLVKSGFDQRNLLETIAQLL